MSTPEPAWRLVDVTTTYLRIAARDGFRPAPFDDPDVMVMEASEPLPAFYRFLYATVGREYHWTDRLAWGEERLHGHLARPAVTVLVPYVRGTPAGYLELDADSRDAEADMGARSTEVAYFGLFSAFQGRGLGRHLLSLGVARAFDDGAERVWVHTCSLDGPHALANYQARGFAAYRSTVHQETIADPPG